MSTALPTSSQPGSIRRSFFLSLAERYVSTVIQFASSVIIARLLTPGEVGVFAVATSILAIIQSVQDLGMTQYIIQEKELTEERYGTAIALTALIGVGFFVALAMGAGPISAFYHEPGLVSVLYLIGIALLIAPLTAPAMAKLQRRLDFAFLLRIGILGAAVSATVSVTLAALGASYLSLAWGSVAGSVTTLTLILKFRWTEATTRPRLSEWRRVLPFGSQSTAASLSSALGMQAAYLIIPRYLGFAAVGLYSRAQGLVGLFSRDIGTTVYRVLLPGFAHSHRTGADLKGPYLKSVAYMTGVAWPFYGFLAIAAEPLILLVFGPAWGEAAPVARVLCVAGAVNATWSTSTQVIMGLGHVRKILSGELMLQPIRILLVLLATRWGITAVAGAQIVTMVIGGAIFIGQLCPLVRMSPLDIMRVTIRSAAVTVCALVPALATLELMSDWVGVLPLRLLLVGLASAAGWLAAITITGHPLKREVQGAVEWLKVIRLRIGCYISLR